MTDDGADHISTGGHGVSRRSVLRATAWSAPVVAMVTVAPAAAAASIVIPDPILPVENPLPVPEPTLPQIPVPGAVKTVPPPIPGVPPGSGPPSVVLPDKLPPKVFQPKSSGLAPASKPSKAPVSEPTVEPKSEPTSEPESSSVPESAPTP